VTAIDPLWPRLDLLLGCLEAALEAAEVPACRTFVHPGASAPWDACGGTEGGAEGQAWVAVERMLPVPSQDQSQRIGPVEFAAEIVVGVLRCAATVDDQGNPPTVAAVMADAQKQTRDAAILRDVLLCCYQQTTDASPGEFRMGGWEPLGPLGGCVGGQWRATILVPACHCMEE
jgi:hypothetical protein